MRSCSIQIQDFFALRYCETNWFIIILHFELAIHFLWQIFKVKIALLFYFSKNVRNRLDPSILPSAIISGGIFERSYALHGFRKYIRVRNEIVLNSVYELNQNVSRLERYRGETREHLDNLVLIFRGFINPLFASWYRVSALVGSHASSPCKLVNS